MQEIKLFTYDCLTIKNNLLKLLPCCKVIDEQLAFTRGQLKYDKSGYYLIKSNQNKVIFGTCYTLQIDEDDLYKLSIYSNLCNLEEIDITTINVNCIDDLYKCKYEIDKHFKAYSFICNYTNLRYKRNSDVGNMSKYLLII